MDDETTRGPNGDDEEVEGLRIIPPESAEGEEVALPHWTAPASGEQPVVGGSATGDDAETWNALSTSGPRWRDAGEDFDESDDIRLLAEDHPQAAGVGATDSATGEQFFGEERVAQAVRRDPGVAPDVLCKSLLDSAVDFAGGPVPDDVAILAVRKD